MIDDETLGEREAAGRISPTAAVTLEQTLGPDWRDATIEEGLAAIAQAFSHTNTTVVATEAWVPFVDALVRRLGAGETMSETLVAATVREVYGEAPTEEQMCAVLGVVENYYRAQRGSHSDESDSV